MRYDRRSTIHLVTQALAAVRGAHAIVSTSNRENEYDPDDDRTQGLLSSAIDDLDDALSSLSRGGVDYGDPST